MGTTRQKSRHDIHMYFLLIGLHEKKRERKATFFSIEFNIHVLLNCSKHFPHLAHLIGLDYQRVLNLSHIFVGKKHIQRSKHDLLGSQVLSTD